jgi:hypothetical protein
MAANIKGRKRHLLVDTQGFVLKAKVHPADFTDRDGVMLLLESVAERFPRASPCLVRLLVTTAAGKARTGLRLPWDRLPKLSSSPQNLALSGFPKESNLIGTRSWCSCRLLAFISYLSLPSRGANFLLVGPESTPEPGITNITVSQKKLGSTLLWLV